MTLKTLATVLALSLAPTLALASGCSDGHQAMSCAAGTTYDAETGTCVTSINS
ncbi:MAG: chitin binding peritrophin-A domain-containing protein [Sulfitobacter sp.]